VKGSICEYGTTIQITAAMAESMGKCLRTRSMYYLTIFSQHET
jgi:hypothetical protein